MESKYCICLFINQPHERAFAARGTAPFGLRQYFPKGSDFSKLTVAAVNRVVVQINLRPRKRLGWKTPYEVYAGVSVALMC